ncbi:MAG TPA: hypothetical protein VGF55_22940 [Gemmataceae bacterium]|jgi:hypothetical protein
MRLTLRTLLAYVDDTLPPDQAHEIGQKVAESHVAQELMERIKKVTRRRGLTVPPAAGPERIDGNTVAEYLDNDLPADRVAEVEELALNSDVHLAEIAACHQILTLVLGEPAHVPPTARERMYGLVTGKESEPHRRASRIGPPAFPGEVESADELRAARRGVGYRLLGALVLSAALAFAVWQALPGRQPAPVPPPATTEPIADANTRPAPEGNPTPAPPPPTPEVRPEVKPDTKPDANPPPPPAVPPTPMPEKVEPPPPPRQPIETPPDRSPSAEVKDVSQYTSRDAVLLTRDGDTWAKVSPDAKVRSGTAVLALPGSHAELKLDSGARLLLWGGLPETTGWKVLDAEATLHVPPAGYDLDFTLDHGRAYVTTAKNPGPTKVRVRFAGEVWDVTLADDQTEVIVEVVRLFAGEPFRRDGKGESPRTEATLGVVKGKAVVKVDAKEFALQAPPGPAELRWDNKGPGVGKPVELDAPPPAWTKGPSRPLPRDRQVDIEAAQRKLVQRLADRGVPIDLAVAEIAQDDKRAAKVLGVLSQGALNQGTPDRLTPLLDGLEDPQLPDVRQAAAVALAHYVARRPGNDVQVFNQLQARRNYAGPQADAAERLLHGFSDAQLSEPATYETLIGALRSDQTGVRELAAWRLRQADPDGAALIRFNAADPEPARDKAVAEWQRRVPAGKLPPGRGGPQGKLPERGPNRG